VWTPALTLLDFYLWVHWKMLAYVKELQTVACLLECIISMCDITSDVIRCVIADWIPPLHLYVSHTVGRVEHIL
jgi:hypothetical protein